MLKNIEKMLYVKKYLKNGVYCQNYVCLKNVEC